MAKLKNLFVGCPVTHKDHPNIVGVVVILVIDPTTEAYVSWANNAELIDSFYHVAALRLAPFPDAGKVFRHLNRFENV